MGRDNDGTGGWLARAGIGIALACGCPSTCAATAVRLGLECEAFELAGDWRTASGGGAHGLPGASGDGWIGSERGAALPAVTAIEIPVAGRYTLWLRTRDFAGDRPGRRLFQARVGERWSRNAFGGHGRSEWAWERGDTFDLPAGPVLLTLADDPQGIRHARADALILSADAGYAPAGTLARAGVQAAKPVPLLTRSDRVPVRSDAQAETPERVLAALENERLRLRFVAARRGGRASVVLRAALRVEGAWMELPVDPSAESYQVVAADTQQSFTMTRFFPVWPAEVDVELGGIRVRSADRSNRSLWGAGRNQEAVARQVTQETPTVVRLAFYPLDAGEFQAEWTLLPEERTARVTLRLRAAAVGQYALGYQMGQSRPLEQVEELLMPMMVQRKRFPERPYTLFNTCAPTPLALMQTREFGERTVCWALTGDPAMTAFGFPVPDQPQYGLQIRSAEGRVQPAIYGPVIGREDAQATPGSEVRLVFRVLFEAGDWYAAYRTAADTVFGWRDYRSAAGTSLTEAALNMIDLYRDDAAGGWWPEALAPDQIEARNVATHASPLTALSLYRLTGDPELYRRRTLPTLAFLLSRSSVHFSPVPQEAEASGYGVGSMDGPVRQFGTATYGAVWQGLAGRSSAFGEIAFPSNTVRVTRGYTHSQPFEDWLARHLFTGDPEALRQAVQQADAYVREQILRPPEREIGPTPFFLIQYTPAWEGLLQLFEVTGERRFLEAAAFGARQVMTGLWTQPMPAGGETRIHPGGACWGDLLDRAFFRGAERYRLGWPRREGDTPERSVARWLVSPVGLGFEQPSTYAIPNNGGRMIFQAPWSAAFLRLARHTGERQFETYARNATLGRWGNYPGYYLTTLTDLMQNPRYPYTGPDVGFIYYHHIAVHLAWTLDYLFSEAALLSGNAVRFPALRQYGYAYFDSLTYGHEPGEVFGEKEVWPWLRRGLAQVENPRIHYLTAHNGANLFVILMNTADAAEETAVRLRPEALGDNVRLPREAERLDAAGGRVPISRQSFRVTLAPRGLAALRIGGMDLRVAAHRRMPAAGARKQPGVAAVRSEGVEARAAALQLEPESWHAYLWSPAEAASLAEFRVEWEAGGVAGSQSVSRYPYELFVAVPPGAREIGFTVSGRHADGRAFRLPRQALGVAE